MSLLVLMIALGVLALLLVGLASIFVFRKGWFFAWLRGSFGIGFFLLAGFLALSIFDISSYNALQKEETLATVSFQELAAQRYKATVVTPGDKTEEYEIAGDLWQIDAKIISWKGPIAVAGFLPAFRLDRLSGRYISIEQERSDQRTVYELHQMAGFDLWQWADSNAWFPLMDTTYGSATFLPMSDAASFSVQLTAKGLIARPLNEPAEQAVTQWN